MTDAQRECLLSLLLEWPISFWAELTEWPPNSLWMNEDGEFYVTDTPAATPPGAGAG